jgi:NADPH2:quinone reductase
MDAANRSVVVTRPGGVEVVEIQDLPVPEPGPGQVLVRVLASGVNFADVYQRQGVYPTATPFVLGTEGAGTVEALGPDVTDVQVGTLLTWAHAQGSHADYAVVNTTAAAEVPEGLAAEQAAAAIFQGMTAQYLVSSTYPVQPGDAVLIHAAAGGVGQLLVQMAKSRGARVIATTSTVEKAAKARELGADTVIDYTQVSGEELAKAVRAANGGEGMSAVYDGVGKDTFEASLASLTTRGMLVLYGGSSGQVPPFDPQRLNRSGSLYLTRPTLVHYLRTRDEFLWRAEEVLVSLADGTLRVEIGGRYPLEDAARAYDDLENRRTTGKLLLTR